MLFVGPQCQNQFDYKIIFQKFMYHYVSGANVICVESRSSNICCHFWGKKKMRGNLLNQASLLSLRLKKVHLSWVYWRRQWHPTPVLLPGKSHGQRSLVGCSPWSPWELDTTERPHFHFSLSYIGEGNGNPLQCSCLENPRVEGAWWAAMYGVAQSRTRLKWLSSSSRKLGLQELV